MTDTSSPEGYSAEERALWARVVELWGWARDRDRKRIESALHPRYVGWDTSTAAPHDRTAAVLSAAADGSGIKEYRLSPHSVQVYDGLVGIAHYSYAATIASADGAQVEVTGKWTEVYLRQEREWVMIAVSGRPDR